MCYAGAVSSKTFQAHKLTENRPHPVSDALAVEAVLHVKVNGEPYTTTVRTPGADEALARGLLYTEGVLVDPSIAPDYHHVPEPDSGFTGCLEITVPDAALAKDIRGRRSSMTNASCGLCGLREAEELLPPDCTSLPVPRKRLSRRAIPGLLEALASRQPLFQETGGAHGALAFTAAGAILTAHEDIGRHNAVDKVIGDLLATGRLDQPCGLVVSGRLSYEIVFKAYRARLPYLLAVSAPSSMAVEMAELFGMCVIAFCREDRATVYSRPALLAD